MYCTVGCKYCSYAAVSWPGWRAKGSIAPRQPEYINLITDILYFLVKLKTKSYSGRCCRCAIHSVARHPPQSLPLLYRPPGSLPPQCRSPWSHPGRCRRRRRVARHRRCRVESAAAVAAGAVPLAAGWEGIGILTYLELVAERR